MKTDDWRLHYTYLFGFFIAGGVLLLVFLKLNEIPPEALVALVTFVLGLVLGFIFNRESSAGASRATERAVQQGTEAASTTVTSPATETKP